MSILEVTNITKSFDDLNVLNDITFQVERGEIVSIIGESGCGKTTLLKIISNLLTQTSGTVTRNYKKIGYIPQHLGLLSWRNVEENIKLSIELSKSNGNNFNLDYILKLLNLEKFSRYMPSQLSGGMQQRVAIGRAIINNPEILYLDEPFRSLDELTRMKLNIELSKIWDQLQTTVILVTHSIKEAVYLSDKIIVLTDLPASIKKVEQIKLKRPREMNNEFLEYEKLIQSYFWR